MRIGMLTSGGDCQCLNATMEAIAKVLYKKIKILKYTEFLTASQDLLTENIRKWKRQISIIFFYPGVRFSELQDSLLRP